VKLIESVVGGLLFLVALGILASVIAIVAVGGTDALKETEELAIWASCHIGRHDTYRSIVGFCDLRR
jgi:hypothetical protein